MVFHWVSTFIPIRLLVTSQQGHKVVQYHKKLNISHDLSCIELKLATVVTLITKFHYMSTVIFPWQHNGLQAFSIQRGKSEFSSFKKCYLLLLFIDQVSANMDITQHKHKKVFNSGATNKAVFTLGRQRSSDECVVMVTS